MTRPTYYKWLTPDHRGVYGHGDYTGHLPHGKRPGKWLPAIADPETCRRGYHVVTASHLPEHWGKVGSVLYVAEVRGEIVTDTDKLACEQIRLTRPRRRAYVGRAPCLRGRLRRTGPAALRGEVPRRRPAPQGDRGSEIG